MKRIKGTVLSKGYGIGKALFLKGDEALPEFSFKSGDPEEELKRFKTAVNATDTELTRLSFDAVKKIGEDNACIFEAQKMILKDESFFGTISRAIADEALTAEYAVSFYADKLISEFEAKEDELFKDRAYDIKDVKALLLKNLMYKGRDKIRGKVIVFTEEVLPSKVASFDRNLVKGIVVKKGSVGGHAALLARALGIPMLLADYSDVSSSDEIILDSFRGRLFINPDKFTRNLYVGRAVKKLKELVLKGRGVESVSVGSHQSKLCANIESLEEGIELSRENIAGIGLFRTEFLFMNETPPTEEEQFEVYKSLLNTFGERPVNIRIFDFGGDKLPKYLESFAKEHEHLRGIRLAIMEEGLLITQLKALLRASVYGNLRVSLPMVYDLSDIENTRDLILRAKVILDEEGMRRKEEADCLERSYDDFALGIMVETRQAVLKASVLADNSDFFSIGTNDLTCELFNLDRFSNHRKLKAKEKSLLFKSVNDCIDAAHRAGIEAGICGEEVQNERSARKFIKAGADYLSF